jgi:hypothetical protein
LLSAMSCAAAFVRPLGPLPLPSWAPCMLHAVSWAHVFVRSPQGNGRAAVATDRIHTRPPAAARRPCRFGSLAVISAAHCRWGLFVCLFLRQCRRVLALLSNKYIKSAALQALYAPPRQGCTPAPSSIHPFSCHGCRRQALSVAARSVQHTAQRSRTCVLHAACSAQSTPHATCNMPGCNLRHAAIIACNVAPCRMQHTKSMQHAALR